MIEEISRLGRETVIVLRIRCHYHFNCLLAHLLRDLAYAPGKQLSGIGAFGSLCRTLGDGPGKPTQQVPTGILFHRLPVRLSACPPYGGREAGAGSGMARGSGLFDPIQNYVTVAVEPDLRDTLDVPRRLPLLPQGAAGSAEIMGQTGGERAIQRVPVCKGNHQYVARAALLGHDRHQSVSTEPDPRQPIVFRHGVKVPAGYEIVKSCWRILSCLHKSWPPPVPVSLLLVSCRSAQPVQRLRSSPAALAGLLVVAACTNGLEPGKPVDCSTATVTDLPVGEHTVIDASQTGCVRLPSAGPSGAEYLYVALATSGTETSKGVSVAYELTGSGTGSPPLAAVQRPRLRAISSSNGAATFHSHLRAMERDLAAHQAGGLRKGVSASVMAQAPPVLGEQRTFNVLKNSTVGGTAASDYVQVTGTAKYVGQHVGIFLDDAAPTPGYTQADIDKVGSIFDQYLYPIDVAAFGSESDINGDHIVLVLLTDRVTKIAGCAGGSVVVGYFFARDLTSGVIGSNGAEIFYGLAPDPTCGITPADAVEFIPRIFIHEFQHMINYNQHVLVRGGSSEETWLNEGLSTFAEELGGRLIPDAVCSNNDCLTQYASSDVENGYNYLSDVENNYLVGPSDRSPPIPLTEYGAAWLFVRWVTDHFGQPPALGTSVTQQLVGTSATGSDNVTAVTGAPFSTLVTQWQMANYLDNLPGFTPSDARLQYQSWDFRQVYNSLHQADPLFFDRVYPLVPDSSTGSYSRSGTLLAGSGRHVLIVQPPSSGEVDFKLTAADGTALPTKTQPRIGLVRIR
jgi:hypothetical protein